MTAADRHTAVRPAESGASVRPPEGTRPGRTPHGNASVRPPEGTTPGHMPQDGASVRPVESGASVRPAQDGASARPTGKTLLVLGGTHFQIPVIRYARSRGHRVVTCDYLPGNPGHALADEYHNVSTTGKDAVLDLARRLRIDGILAFASDPAAPTAAWVAEHMDLPGNPYQTVRMMSEKDLFRAFLQDHGFRCPAFRAYRSVREMHADPQRPPLPVMVKPVDSSGSKGVGRADRPDQLGPLFRQALPLSRAGRVILEQCIDGHQLHGDGFVCDGKLVFSCLGDHQAAGALNSSTLYPSRYPADLIARIQAETQRFLDLAGFRQGGINIEARLDGDREPFHIIEIGPRNGGHFTPDIITHATGFDFVSLSVDTCLGAPCTPAPLRPSPHPQGWFTNLVLYAPRPGRYAGVQLSPELEPFLLEKHLYKHRGDQLGSGTTSQTAVGTLLLKFGDRAQMERVIARNRDFYRVDMEPAPRESIDA